MRWTRLTSIHADPRIQVHALLRMEKFKPVIRNQALSKTSRLVHADPRIQVHALLRVEKFKHVIRNQAGLHALSMQTPGSRCMPSCTTISLHGRDYRHASLQIPRLHLHGPPRQQATSNTSSRIILNVTTTPFLYFVLHQRSLSPWPTSC